MQNYFAGRSSATDTQTRQPAALEGRQELAGTWKIAEYMEKFQLKLSLSTLGYTLANPLAK